MSVISRATLCFLLTLLAAWGQVSTGAISGQVMDPSGSAVSGATIAIISQATNVRIATTVNPSGFYAFPFLPPGVYRAEITASGFPPYVVSDVTLMQNAQLRLDVQLKFGSRSETITVNSAAPLVEETNAQVTSVTPSRKIMSFAQMEAGLLSLALLAPGVQAGFREGDFTVNGQRSRSVNFLIEGQDNNNPSFGIPSLLIGNPEAVSEFSVITSFFSAEYGRNAGAVMNIGLRSGTNSVHVAVNYRHRNDRALGALTNFQRRADLAKAPKNIDNYFGGSVTGPVIRDRWFFMGYGYNNQVRNEARAESTASTLTPTPAGIAALSRGFPQSPTVRLLRDAGPFSVRFGVVQAVPVSSITLQSAAGPVAVEMGRIIRGFARPFDSVEAGTRQDLYINERHRITGRYLYQDRRLAASFGNALNGYIADEPLRNQNAGGSHTWTLSPRAVNEARISYVANFSGAEGGGAVFPFSETGRNIANFLFDDGTLSFGPGITIPQYTEFKRWQFQNQFSLQAGRHFFKAGVQIAHDRNEIGFLPNVNGRFFFANLQAFADNRPRQFNLTDGEPLQRPRQTDRFFFLQDDWKVTSELTINLGLRYEYSGQPLNVLNDITVARESNPLTSLFDPAIPIQARTVPRLKADSNNFQPRVGFAYSSRSTSPLWRNTVWRGGWSVMNDPVFYNLLVNVQTSAPAALAFSLTGRDVPVTEDFTGANLQRITPRPQRIDPRTLNQTQFDPGFRLPMVHTWSFGMQRRLGSRQAVEIRYVGNAANGLFATANGNPLVSAFVENGWQGFLPPGVVPGVNPGCTNCNGRLDPAFAAVRQRSNAAFSRYHGLQSRFDGEIGKSLLIGAAYTWSRNIDTVSEVFEDSEFSSVGVAQNPFNVSQAERGVSNLDLQHVFTVNGVWELPWWKSQRGWLGRALGGWQVAGITRWQGGRPLQPLQTGSGANTINDRLFLGAFFGARDQTRPFSANPSAPNNTVARVLSDGRIVNFFEPRQETTFRDVRWIYNDAHSARLLGTPFGIGRNVLRGPRLLVTDAAFYKNVAVGEKLRFQLRLEATNFFNHTNLGVPSSEIEGGVETFLNPQETESRPRVLTVGLRLLW